MTKKPSRLGLSCLVSDTADPAPHDDDDISASSSLRPRRGSPQSPRSRTPIPSPSKGLLALLASFATPTIIPAHAAPTPVSPNALRTHPSPGTIPTPIYLDFLYPRPRLPPPQHPHGPSHPPEDPPDPPRRIRKPRSFVSTADDCECVIPTKFEENDTGWMVAERWTLHGKTHPNAFAGYIPVSSFRPQMDSVDNSLDLPTGWNTTTSSRNARYDPIIVTVFAIILACGITGAIAASVWRQQLNTRRFRVDLERATKPKRRRTTDEVDSVDSDATVEEDKPRTKKKRRRKNAAGSGGGAVTPGAGKPSSTFWRPSPRFVGRLRFRSRRHKPAEVPATEPPIVSSRPASPQPDLPTREDLANPPIIHVAAEEDSSSHVHSRHPSHIDLTLSSTNIEDANPNNSETQPEPERIPANSVSTGLPLPVSPIHLNHSLDQSQSMQDVGDDTALRRAPTFEGYTSNPPAYLRIGTSCTSRQTEKAPLPGLEAEYDERDLGRWRASRLAASSSSSRPRPRSIAPSAIEPELDTPPPPSLNRVHGVHIATDDKTALARLHSFADQPDAPVPPAEALSISGSPTVPAFGVVEDWYTETQLEQVSSLDQSSSQALPAPVLNPLTFPPPPEPYLLSRRHGSLVHDRSYHDTQDMNEAYTFRRVWGGTTSSIGPSAPPMEIEEGSSSRRVGQDESLEGLVPSAPPLPGDPISGAHIPSAPALWDEENETYEPARDSAPPLEASRELPLGDQLSGSASDNSRGGADAHSDVRVQWVQQRQVEMEGMGLPKYEP